MIPGNDPLHEPTEAGRRLGHDLYTCTRWAPQPDWPEPVLEGFDSAAFDRRRRSNGDRFTRKWLQLRLGALRRGRAVADDVTPALLAELDVASCPVTRQPLTHGLGADTDASVDRLNNHGAYAASNLAVLSVRANRAKGSLSFAQVLALSEQQAPVHGLLPIEWLRLAALMLGPAYATRPHEAPRLPLCAPLPRHAVRLALQQLQHLLTLHGLRPASRNRLVKDLLPACGSDSARLRLLRLGDLAHDTLRRTVAEGRPACDAWLSAPLMQALVDWQDALSTRGWAHAALIAGRLAGARRETPTLLARWQLPSRGYLPGLAPARA